MKISKDRVRFAMNAMYAHGVMRSTTTEDEDEAAVRAAIEAAVGDMVRDAERLSFITREPGQFSAIPKNRLNDHLPTKRPYVIHMQGLGYFRGTDAREAIDAALLAAANEQGNTP